MKRMNWMIGIVFLAAAVPVRAGVVVDHQPSPFGGPASDTAFIDPLSTLTAQLEADDFLLAVDATIRHITWWGFYGSSATSPAEQPPDTQTFRMRFYDARPSDGLPGNVFFEESFLDPSFAGTGRIILAGAGPDEFKFDVNLPAPVILSADTPYWLEIVQIGDLDSLFRWENSVAELNGHAFQNEGVGDWQHSQPITSDLAFQLSTIPEPASAALWVIAVITLFSRGGRKGHRHDVTHFGDSIESPCS